VHALYAFARVADDIIDCLDRPDPARLIEWSEQALRCLKDPLAPAPDGVVRAVAHTATVLDLDHQLFVDFLESMRSDIHVTRYATYDDLRAYMWGSAAVIGLMMLPLLGPLSDDARMPAIALGEAFQLTNFIRDVGEDLRRGRVYLPLEDLDRFGVTVQDLGDGVITDDVRRLLSFQVERARGLYAVAASGVALVEPVRRPCLQTAISLYAGILDEVERADYQVLTRRVSVPRRRRLAVAVPALVRAAAARREAGRWREPAT
jgi:phytoene synthase